jgi:hypothetical protein
MKRSKMFLGLTTGILAIVGIAAAKSHKSTVRTGFYWTGGSSSKCTKVSSTVGVTHTSTEKGTTVLKTSGHTVFSVARTLNGQQCNSNKLYTYGQNPD